MNSSVKPLSAISYLPHLADKASRYHASSCAHSPSSNSIELISTTFLPKHEMVTGLILSTWRF